MTLLRGIVGRVKGCTASFHAFMFVQTYSLLETHTHTHTHIQTQAPNGGGRVLPLIPPLVNSQSHESTKGTNHMTQAQSITQLLA